MSRADSTTIGVCMCKDEADVIAGTLLHMADEVDELIVADNRSTDGTREILAELEDLLPLTVIDDPEVGYFQSRKMTDLANLAADRGATFVVPFDADELWIGPYRVRDILEGSGADVVTAKLFDHYASAIDPAGDDPFETIIYRKCKPSGLPKVAFRWLPGIVVHQGNHGVTTPGDRVVDGLEVRHFPYRSPEQFVRKARNGAAAYKATDLPEHEGAHWRQYGELLERFGESALEDVYREWFWARQPHLMDMIHDPAPYRRWRS
jgi:glycosyltransferase involved in cell wall biosynthesis